MRERKCGRMDGRMDGIKLVLLAFGYERDLLSYRKKERAALWLGSLGGFLSNWKKGRLDGRMVGDPGGTYFLTV